MSNSVQEFLFLFGWSEFFSGVCESGLPGDPYDWGRVICEERGLYRVQVSASETVSAVVSGKMQFQAKSRADYPAVGDWVRIDASLSSDRGVIHEIAPRKTTVYRKQIGASSDQQILSTNVDTIYITTAVNEDLNFRRIERYLTIARASGARPVILLTKIDLRKGDAGEIVTAVRAEFPEVEVEAISYVDFEASPFLSRDLKPGTTSVFLGSSGVGKSTLVNFLIGEQVMKAQGIREGDGKGRHTTTARHLFVSRYGGLVIDTPGMRELQLSDHGEAVSSLFSDVEALMTRCRFTDCQHLTEPDCAIKNALEAGELAPERWRNFCKLEAEARHGLRKRNKAIASEDRRVWKKRAYDARERGRSKRD